MAEDSDQPGGRSTGPRESVRQCVAGAAGNRADAEQKTQELLDAVRVALRRRRAGLVGDRCSAEHAVEGEVVDALEGAGDDEWGGEGRGLDERAGDDRRDGAGGGAGAGGGCGGGGTRGGVGGGGGGWVGG